MLIATYLDQNNESRRNFSKWRNWAKGDWKDCIVGEWSTMSGTFGTHQFFYRVSDCRKFWALKLNGFPTRIVAAAVTEGDARTEEVIGRMVKRVENAGGEWIEGVFGAADGFDLDAFWRAYNHA
jgi:hypothetical protein